LGLPGFHPDDGGKGREGTGHAEKKLGMRKKRRWHDSKLPGEGGFFLADSRFAANRRKGGEGFSLRGSTLKSKKRKRPRIFGRSSCIGKVSPLKGKELIQKSHRGTQGKKKRSGKKLGELVSLSSLAGRAEVRKGRKEANREDRVLRERTSLFLFRFTGAAKRTGKKGEWSINHTTRD